MALFKFKVSWGIQCSLLIWIKAFRWKFTYSILLEPLSMYIFLSYHFLYCYLRSYGKLAQWCPTLSLNPDNVEQTLSGQNPVTLSHHWSLRYRISCPENVTTSRKTEHHNIITFILQLIFDFNLPQRILKKSRRVN